MSEDRFDVVVTGIGHQGLIAACLLARKGKRVAVLDVPSAAPGGGPYDMFAEGARTGPIAHMPVPVSRDVVETLQLAARGFQMRPEQTCCFAPVDTESGAYIFATSSRQATLREIAKFSEEDANRFMELADDASALAAVLDEVADTLPPYDQNGWKDLWAVFETGRLLADGDWDLQESFVRLLTNSLDRLLDDTFEHDAVKGFLGLQSTVGSMTPASRKGSASAFVYALLGMYEAEPYKTDWQPLRGNLHELMKALTQAAIDMGVAFFPGRMVSRLELEHGQIARAVLDDGAVVAGQMFIADTNPLVLFDTLLGRAVVPREFDARLAPIRERAGFVRLKMVVNALPKFACLSGSNPESFLSGDILIAPSLEYLTKARLESRSEGVPSLPAVSVSIPSIVSPELAPEGKHVVSILAQPFVAEMSDEPETRNAVASAAVRAVEMMAPGFQNTIETIAVYLEENVNKTIGPMNRVALGGGHPLVQLFAARFGHHGIGYDLPFANLLICGYGPEASAAAHVNRGGEIAAATVLRML